MRTRTKRVLLTLTTALAVSLPLGLTGTSATAAPRADDPSLTQAAALNGMSQGRLSEILATDPTAHLDEQGRMYYADPAPAPAPTSVQSEAAPFPLGQTFLLHSKPASKLTIYLDFDGTDVSGTQWNSNAGLPNAFYPAYTIDGDDTTFNDAEREVIQGVWQRVAEDYAPFDVDVTTQDPGVAGLERTSAGDDRYGSRLLVTPSTTAHSALCGGGCGGIAYLNVFGATNGGANQPAWVFSQTMFDNPKYIAEAASHEVGHNLSLNHDGTTVGQGAPCTGQTGYYCGHAMWTPIMGASYYAPLSQWSKGEYQNANNTGEDDLALIAARAPYAADEAGGTVGTAASSLPTGSAIITTASDVDLFRLGTCSGAVSLAANGAAPSPNLDIQLALVDSSGSVVAQDDPASAKVDYDTASGLNAAISTSVPSGVYYARVLGTGFGNPLDTGYSDYASVGSYTVTQTGCGGGGSAPGKPTVTSSTPSAGQVSVAFTPGTDGGSPITSYQAQCVSTNGGVTKTATGTASPITVPALSGGKNYHCRVRATNAVGTSAYSPYGATVLVPGALTAPPAPSITSSTGVGGGVRVAFAPNGDGGSPITSYAVRCESTNGGVPKSISGPSSPITVTGLTIGRTYRCRVRATNAVGTGPYSAFGASGVVAAGPPLAPTVTATQLVSGGIRVRFASTGDGGSPITNYQAQCVSTDGGATRTNAGTATPITVSSLTAAKTYRCRVRATNAVGVSPYGAYGDPVVTP